MTRMIRSGFLDTASRKELMALVRNAKAESRVTRRANGILLLDDGLSCAQVAKVLYMDDDTIRYWYGQYMSCGIRWLGDFGYKGRACELTTIQQDKLKIWIRETLPRSTSEIDEWIEKTFEVSYTRSGLIKLLGRLDMVYRKPETVPRGLDVAKQKAFIAAYEDLQNNLDPDETVVFVDAVHPTHEGRAAGCWAPKDVKAALPQTSKRDRLNIHGAIDLETGQTRMINVLTVDAQSTISLLSSLEKRYPDKRKIHVYLDNAKYHHARIVKNWLARYGFRVTLHFVPAYCPHLAPIERLWGLMHRNVTHNKCYKKFNGFCKAILKFLTEDVPKNWHIYCDQVTDNFRIIDPQNFRVLKET